MIKLWRSSTLIAAALLSIVAVAPAVSSTVQPNYISGNIKDITSVHGALLIRMDDDRVPTQCQPSGSFWMKIDQSDTAMISTVLMYWGQGKTGFTMYIDNWTGGYCTIGQADPIN